MLRELAAIGTVLAVGAGCSYDSSGGFIEVCGTTLFEGGSAAIDGPLQRPGPAPADGPAPVRDVLPGKQAFGSRPLSDERYIIFDDNCEQGLVVTLYAHGTAYLVKTAKAKDKHLAAIVVDTDDWLTIQAWRGGVFAGSLKLTPRGRL